MATQYTVNGEKMAETLAYLKKCADNYRFTAQANKSEKKYAAMQRCDSYADGIEFTLNAIIATLEAE